MLNTIKIWIISGWIHLIVGFVIGWIVFKRPAWADTLFGKIKSRIPLLNRL